MNRFSDVDRHLLNDFQHHFPLLPRPFQRMAQQLELDEQDLMSRLRRLIETGAISRIGPVFNPGCIGVSTLAALAVPEDALQEIADWLNGFPEINHNYQREHEYNIWFVVTAPNQARLTLVLEQIAAHGGYPMLVLPMEQRFHIDLGFDLNSPGVVARKTPVGASQIELTESQTGIVAALQSGISLQADPFAAIGQQLCLDENKVLEQIVAWKNQGVIKRFGVVVRHHELGFSENAMVVWNVPDDQIDAIGRESARQPCVTLCYQRPRQLPDWPYNLFCMVHGTDRVIVQTQVARLARETGLDAFPSRILFSCRRFKQNGARYVLAA